MTRTRFLVMALAVVILLRLFPDHSTLIQGVAVSAIGLFCAIWFGARFLSRHRARRRQERLEAADTAEYRDYEHELAQIRERHDETSPQFQAEVSALLERHRDMLGRKFGPPRPGKAASTV